MALYYDSQGYLQDDQMMRRSLRDCSRRGHLALLEKRDKGELTPDEEKALAAFQKGAARDFEVEEPR